MKFKTTKKAIMANFSKIICVPYCELQFLLKYESPIAYTAGVYGWNADIYDFNGATIVTGYRPFGNICPDRQIIEKYEKEAGNICHNYSYEEGHKALRELQKKFMEEVLKNDQKRILRK